MNIVKSVENKIKKMDKEIFNEINKEIRYQKNGNEKEEYIAWDKKCKLIIQKHELEGKILDLLR